MTYTQIVLKSDAKLQAAIKECEENKKAIIDGKKKPLSFDEFKKLSLKW